MNTQTEADAVDTVTLDALELQIDETLQTNTAPLKIFYSYAHTDEEFRDGLDNHLRLLQRQGLISAWHDRKIGAGTEWREQIDQHLRSADLVFLLVSADFLASDYCFDIELQCALDRHKAGEAVVIPVIVRPVDWSGAPFAELQALPRDGKAISSWSDRDDALMNVARAVRSIVQQQARKQETKKAPPKHGGSDPSDEHNRRLSTERVVAVLFAAAVLGSVSWVWLLHAHPEFSKLSNGASVVSALERGKYLYGEKDYQGAAKLFLQAAENGSAEAADILGTLYEYGLGTQPDCKTAMTWFRRAAKGSSSKAMDHLGLLFEHGCGVKLDNNEAKRWFDKAASLGNSDAMNNLGWMYANNLGVATDYQRAIEYFRKAADLQNGDAMNNIGWLYQNGWGFPKPDPREANRWFKKAAAAKSTLGMNSLGWVYENGFGIANRDYQQALEWFRRAADAANGLGSSWAMNNIGDMYEKGYVGAPNREEAVKWYTKSAENGFPLAKSNLERLGMKVPEDKPCCPVTLNSVS
jgi:TPR repeat protein